MRLAAKGSPPLRASRLFSNALVPGLRQTDQWKAAESDVASDAVYGHALYPGLRSARGDIENKRAAIAVTARSGECPHLGDGQLGPYSLSHVLSHNWNGTIQERYGRGKHEHMKKALGFQGLGVNPGHSTERPGSRIGSPGRTRTSDPAVNSRLLYQLSYRGSSIAVWPLTSWLNVQLRALYSIKPAAIPDTTASAIPSAGAGCTAG